MNNNKNNNKITRTRSRVFTPTNALLAAILIAVLAFAIGNSVSAHPGDSEKSGQPGSQKAGQSKQRPGPPAGTIAEVSSDSIVLETRDGREITVAVSEDTPVALTSPSSLSELEVGDRVFAPGERDGEGSIDAKAVIASSADLELPEREGRGNRGGPGHGGPGGPGGPGFPGGPPSSPGSR